MKTLLTITVCLGLCLGVRAEMRTWTFKTGETLEAEYVRTLFDKLRLKDASGAELTIPIEKFSLSAEDQEYLELENPPVLDVSIKKAIEKKNFAMVRGAEDRPPEWRATFGAKVVQKSTGEFNHELTVEFFAIGQEIIGDRYILLDRMSSSFTPTKANKRMHEFHSKRIVRMTDMWDNSDTFSRRGEQYFGYLIVVRDKRGKIVAMNGSNKWLEENLENLQKLRIGNYMDKTCIRTYPTRPKSYIAARASGRT